MTQTADVIGDPISQSKSPLMHNFWLKKLGIDAHYEKQHILPENSYIETSSANADWRGCNVTLPHKIPIMDLVNDPGDVRGGIGAMNTVFRSDDGSMMGTNTDAAGFMAPISNRDWQGSSAVVIGAGGAARAILFALKQSGVSHVTILARSQLKAMGLLSRFGLKGDVLAMDTELPKADLLVNTSPLGMVGKEPLEISLDGLPDDATVYDIVYNPLDTELLKSARMRGMEAIDGLDMFIGQAALAFELFFKSPPPDDCEDELRKLLLT